MSGMDYPVELGDYVVIENGCNTDEYLPIPKTMRGILGRVVATGRKFKAVTSGSVYCGALKHRYEFSEPVDELKVHILEAPHIGTALRVEGLFLRKLSPMEVIARQAE